MAQHSGVIADQSGLAFLVDLNNALMADKTLNSGATEPATKYPGMLWLDTSGATPVLKQRNQANDGWGTVSSLIDAGIMPSPSASGFVMRNATNDGNETKTADEVTVSVSRVPSASGRNIAARTNATTPNSKVDITADELIVRDSNGNSMMLSAVSQTIDITVAGAGGLDTGMEASGTWYYGHIIAKADGTVSALLSVSATAPTMPSGYTFKALVTAVRNDGSSNFVKYRQFGFDVTYEAAQTVSSALNATTEASFSTAAQVPPIATGLFADIDPNISANGSGEYDAVFNLGFVSGAYVVTDRYRATGHAASLVILLPSRSVRLPNISQTLYYDWEVTTGSTQSATLTVTGFRIQGGGE